MEAKLEVVDKGGGSREIKLLKLVDYSTAFPEKLPAGTATLVIDCADVTYISSAGLFQWVRWLGGLMKENPGTKIEFTHMVAPFIRAQEMSKDFIPDGAVVRSFYYDYFCPDCRTSKHVLCDNGPQAPKTSEACSGCKKTMELELPPQSYDSLRKRAPGR